MTDKKMSPDFIEGYKAAIAFIRFRTKFLRLEVSTAKRKRLSDAYYDLIDELIEHLKYNEDLEKEETNDA